MTTPPLAGRRFRTSSGTLRAWSISARALEWEKMTGARVAERASCIVLGETWLKSTIIPSRFISRMSARPNGVSPSWTGSSVAESAQSLFFEWVRVM